MTLIDDVKNLPATEIEGLYFRLAAPPDPVLAMTQMNMAGDAITTILRFYGMTASVMKQLLDDTFMTRVHYFERRFSKEFPALYSAIELETAKQEVNHWIHKRWAHALGAPPALWYLNFSVAFSGKAKDVRPLVPRYPELIADTDYTACQEVGRQVRAENIDALLATSVRHPPGTCVPIFTRSAAQADTIVGELSWHRLPDGTYKMP